MRHEVLRVEVGQTTTIVALQEAGDAAPGAEGNAVTECAEKRIASRGRRERERESSQ